MKITTKDLINVQIIQTVLLLLIVYFMPSIFIYIFIVAMGISSIHWYTDPGFFGV